MKCRGWDKHNCLTLCSIKLYSVLKIYEHPILITSYCPMQKVGFSDHLKGCLWDTFLPFPCLKLQVFYPLEDLRWIKHKLMNPSQSLHILGIKSFQNQILCPCLVYDISAVGCISGFFYSPHNWRSWILQIFIMHSKKLLRTHQRFILNTLEYYMLYHIICRNSVCCCVQRGNTTNYKSLYLLPTLYLRVQAHISYCFVRCAHKISYNEYNV